MTGEDLRVSTLCAAFWLAWGLALRAPAMRALPAARRAAEGRRAAFALLLGAAAAHLGWVLLDAPLSTTKSWLLLDASRGHALLFSPLGVFVAAPRGAGRRAFVDAALGSQPAAWALAKLGCLAAGCCSGTSHPVALYEAAAFLALHGLAARLAARPAAPRPGARAATALLGLGALRLASQPLRAAPSPSPTFVTLLALAWMLTGAVGLRRAALAAHVGSSGTRPRLSMARRTTSYSASLKEKRRKSSAPTA